MIGIIHIISGALIFTAGLIFYMSSKRQPIQTHKIIMLQKPTKVVNTQPVKVENISELEKQPNEKDTLILKREPQNPYDVFAVEAFRDNAKLGHLPRANNKVAAQMTDQGLDFKARIRHINPDAHPYRRVKLKVYYEMG